MKKHALFVLMSRAEVVDFDAMVQACASGHIKAATDVFPEEPLALDHPARSTSNLVLSAHRAGALKSALLEIGERTLADLRLMAKGLPPQNCKRAEAELVSRVRSKPIDKS
jgi:phosphoglycerate dehydrogenase-like enzyme